MSSLTREVCKSDYRKFPTCHFKPLHLKPLHLPSAQYLGERQGPHGGLSAPNPYPPFMLKPPSPQLSSPPLPTPPPREAPAWLIFPLTPPLRWPCRPGPSLLSAWVPLLVLGR